MPVNDIYSQVILSRKYAHLYAPLIMRVCREEYAKHKKDKDRVKAVKNKLHMIYGAFVGDDWHRRAEALINSGAFAEVMRLHASTSERLGAVGEFYGFIFDTVGAAESILDIACGFNPFALEYMPGIKKYYALDIDCRAAGLINLYFRALNLPELAGCIDIIAETPQDCADVAFMFKLMPVIEAQAAGRAFGLLREINAAHIVVTYPVKSLGGREKGMRANYARAFEAGLGDGFKIAAQAIIGSELVYVIEK